MRLFTQLDPETYEEIEELVQRGEFDSADQFLRVAAINQLAIEKSESNTTFHSNKAEGESKFRWEYSPPTDIPTGPPFDKQRDNVLLFSQYYRFFPLKCALYTLAKLTADAGGAVPLDRVRSYVSEAVWPIRKGIFEWEERNSIKKQNRKSTGFPKDSDNSMKRYLDHYVGKVQTQKGQPAGFGHDLGYVSFREDEMDWEVQLTALGSQFVHIDNPLLANGPDFPPLSEEEQAFIIESIHENLDEEYLFMRHIYDILSNADGSYTDYLPQFREFLEESTATPDEMSENSVRSQVGGAISRMVELGILERGSRRGYYNTATHPDEKESASVQQQ